MHTKPTHTYIAQKPCGCLVLMSSDMPDLRAETAAEIARAIIAGYRPGYVTHEEAHTLPWVCDRCATEGSDAPDTPVELDRASTDPTASWWHVTGTATYRVTVQVNARIHADDAQQATDAVFEAMMPTCLRVEADAVDVNGSDDGRDDTLHATETHRGAGQLALGL